MRIRLDLFVLLPRGLLMKLDINSLEKVRIVDRLKLACLSEAICSDLKQGFQLSEDLMGFIKDEVIVRKELW